MGITVFSELRNIISILKFYMAIYIIKSFIAIC
jgi:hypothetical protein